MKHLELFAGIGGFRRALDLIGKDFNIPMECVGFSEIEPKAVKTYKANFEGTENEIEMGDIVEFTSNEENIKSLPDFDLLTGGFPCQSFSMMGKQEGFEDEHRGQMFFRIVDILKIKRPKYILLENVKNLKNHDKGNTFAVIKQTLEDLGYNVKADVFNTSDFHLAQIRNRVYIFGTLENNQGFEFTSNLVLNCFNEGFSESSVEKQNNVLDVLEKQVDDKYFLSERIKPTILSNGSGGFVSNSEINQIIARPLTASMHKMHRACQDNYYSQDFIESNGSINPALNLTKEELCKLPIRKITPKEAMMLQGFPSYWSERGQSVGVTDGALLKQAGNAVSVNTVYAVLRYLITNNLIK